MRICILIALALVGCAKKQQAVRRFDSCGVIEVSRVEEKWRTVCVNQWRLKTEVIFDKEVMAGDVVLYIPYKENDGG